MSITDTQKESLNTMCPAASAASLGDVIKRSETILNAGVPASTLISNIGNVVLDTSGMNAYINVYTAPDGKSGYKQITN